MRILISGGTGFVGTSLVRFLQDEGHEITLLTRSSSKMDGTKTLPYPIGHDLLSPEIVASFQAIINLAGASIASTRWNVAGKKLIMDSRMQVTKLLTDSIQNNKRLGLSYPSIFISTSAVGYYGISDEAIFDENSANGKGFLANVAQAWETQARAVEPLGLRLVVLRFGIVLGDGGILSQIRKPFDYHVGGFLGSGRQWISWVHIHDLIQMIDFVLNDKKASGIFNACSPNPTTMKDLTNALSHALHRLSFTRMPGFVVHLLLGEMADELILHGQKVYPKRLLEKNFSWIYTDINEAVQDSVK